MSLPAIARGRRTLAAMTALAVALLAPSLSLAQGAVIVRA
jgi:hypothetical protein